MPKFVFDKKPISFKPTLRQRDEIIGLLSRDPSLRSTNNSYIFREIFDAGIRNIQAEIFAKAVNAKAA